MTPKRGPTLGAVIVLLAVLASGVLLGVVIDRALLARRGALPPGSFMSPWRMGRILADLNLTPAQQTAIDSILAVRHEDLLRVRAQVHPELDALRLRTEAEVRALLTPAQSAVFDRNLDRARRFGPPDRGPGPHGPRWRREGRHGWQGPRRDPAGAGDSADTLGQASASKQSPPASQ